MYTFVEKVESLVANSKTFAELQLKNENVFIFIVSF